MNYRVFMFFIWMPSIHTMFNSIISNIIKGNRLKILPQIKYDNLPICSKCIHFIPNGSRIDLGKCKMRGEKGLVDGYVVYEYAENMRNNNERCGISGLYYIENPVSSYKPSMTTFENSE
jgi:hypothetical protein